MLFEITCKRGALISISKKENKGTAHIVVLPIFTTRLARTHHFMHLSKVLPVRLAALFKQLHLLWAPRREPKHVRILEVGGWLEEHVQRALKRAHVVRQLE